jgi:hypothetical protein
MFLIEVFKEKSRKSVAFCFGRMNPPTIGHARLLNTTARASAGGDYYIFLSHTQDSKKNPLDYNTKVDFVKAIYPQHADHVSHGSLRTIMEIMEFLYHNNYTDVIYICGNDRLPAFKELLNKYNGVEGGKTYYKFNSIDIVSSGPRDPDDDGIAGVSASAARAAAEAGNKEEFKKITGAGRFAPQLYKAVRKGMLKEDASGYIPKNKREAKDSRWSNALTVDVRPDTPAKNLKAFKLV